MLITSRYIQCDVCFGVKIIYNWEYQAGINVGSGLHEWWEILIAKVE